MKLKIVSGGQTGVDRGALDAALDHMAPCGGWCPQGRLAEDGPIPQRYPLRELEARDYAQRTLRNVMDSDATLIVYFGELEGGTALTKAYCAKRRKPYVLIDATRLSEAQATAMTRDFITHHRTRVLNVAGPRASKEPQAYEYTYAIVSLLLEEVAGVGLGVKHRPGHQG